LCWFWVSSYISFALIAFSARDYTRPAVIRRVCRPDSAPGPFSICLAVLMLAHLLLACSNWSLVVFDGPCRVRLSEQSYGVWLSFCFLLLRPFLFSLDSFSHHFQVFSVTSVFIGLSIPLYFNPLFHRLNHLFPNLRLTVFSTGRAFLFSGVSSRCTFRPPSFGPSTCV